ncbi:MAG: DUF3267 domain-containing protein [Chloroflexaceae bacterium]|jgi:hypothetical protein|nr:DUF3267 domain-containing protein [Chloroflexaceae bacterium]
MQATPSLPPEYVEQSTLDLSRQKGLALGLNLAAVGLFVLLGWLALRLLPLLRPDVAELGGTLGLELFVLLALVLAGQVVLHELMHGLFFWLFSRARPHFGFKGWYAYAAAPGWFFPRGQFLVIGLAPLVLITLLGLLLVLVLPGPWLPLPLLVVVMNGAGSVGDLVAAVWLLRQPSSALFQDNGAAMVSYQPAGGGR